VQNARVWHNESEATSSLNWTAMAHTTSKSYYNLQKRLDQAPQGAPASETLFKILEVLLTKDEAQLVSALPINLFTVKQWVRSSSLPRNASKSVT